MSSNKDCSDGSSVTVDEKKINVSKVFRLLRNFEGTALDTLPCRPSPTFNEQVKSPNPRPSTPADLQIPSHTSPRW